MRRAKRVALVLVVLVIVLVVLAFVLENQQAVSLSFFGWRCLLSCLPQCLLCWH